MASASSAVAGRGAKKRPYIFLWSTLAAAALAAVMVFVLASPRYISVPSGSMLPSIRVGDSVFVESLTYRFRGPQSGDIVLFDAPFDSSLTLLKRVVAVGGQQVDVKDGHLIVDGAVLSESYVFGQPTEPLTNSRIVLPVQIPDGYVWVMGDNRTASQDSRYFGPLAVSAIRGKIAGVQ